MAKISPGASDLDDPRLVIESTKSLFRAALHGFNQMNDRILQGDMPAGRDWTKILATLHDLQLALIKEMQKHDKDFPVAGNDTIPAIDFDAARDAIGGRLNRIRTAGRARSVSDVSDKG